MIKVKNILTGRNESLKLSGDVVSLIRKKQDSSGEILMAPGLFDIQVNGYNSIDFNDDELSVERIEQVVKAHLKDGVTGFLPTLITNDIAIIERNLELFNRAISGSDFIRSCIPGIHLEGPFISSEEGFSGAHDKQWARNPDWSLFEKWQHISGNRIKLITLAPELDGSLEFIRSCTKNNVKVAIGHSAAGPKEIREAADYGATLSTHLGNAIPKYLQRHNNAIINQLAEDRLSTSIIADGHHLTNNLIKLILKLKKSKVLLVSDSTKFSSMAPGVYQTVIGGEVILKANRQLAVSGGDGQLAGSASALYQCVNYLSRENLLPLTEAWEAASLAPISYMDNILGTFRGKNMVLFTYENDGINIIMTLKDNKCYS